ncbi:uncharacterized protein EV422DRAFT_514602 [Fimicolochytrium jonesii]|uniref:uncharacterized protein n=1 Tax=Fimicolochytrium jonesii TaxID=1396493 RepID=UPI0022FE6FAC|nr:uncharacterized protein EV422DRAFT_514602 [Fimicolochytrium jonesii]KAI8825895.1 hypothetical protein EV422DRAFT_514602 [Fimicolochytrium jonesii]
MDLRTVDRTLARVQQVSGLAFSSFSALHLGGHLLASFSFSLADTALFASRVFYQNPVVEPLVVGASLVVHIGSSLARVVIRTRNIKKLNSRLEKDKLENSAEKMERTNAAEEVVKKPAQTAAQRELQFHRLSGYVLTALVGVHVLATRITPLKVLPDTSIIDLTFVTHSLRADWTAPLFYPYYIILGTAGIYHTAFGIQQALSSMKLMRKRVNPGTWTTALLVSAGIMTLAILGIAGIFEDVPIPLASKWHDLTEVMPLVAMGKL